MADFEDTLAHDFKTNGYITPEAFKDIRDKPITSFIARFVDIALQVAVGIIVVPLGFISRGCFGCATGIRESYRDDFVGGLQKSAYLVVGIGFMVPAALAISINGFIAQLGLITDNHVKIASIGSRWEEDAIPKGGRGAFLNSKSGLGAFLTTLVIIVGHVAGAGAKKVSNYSEFKSQINSGAFIDCGWDGSPETESKIKSDTNATIRCIPMEQNINNLKCIYTEKPAKYQVIFAKAY